MKDLNYLKKLISETIEGDIRSKSRNRKQILESQKRKLHKKKLMEGLQKALSVIEEKADPAKFDPERFPSALSDVAKDPNMAYRISTGGKEEFDAGDDDDVIPYEDKKNIASVQQLKPSQSSMNIEKALAFALGHIKSGKPGGHLGAFVSNDMFIMDGHHRWVSSGMVDPNATLGGYLVDFPGKELVAVLNNLTVGRFNKLQGKPATGGFDQFKEGPIRTQLEEYLANGSGDAQIKTESGEMVPNEYYISPEEVQELIEKFSGVTGEGAKEAAVKKFVENLGKLTMSTPNWAMGREEMPVIEKEDSQTARDALEKGEIDVNPPYAEDSSAGDKQPENSSYNRSGNVMLERWSKLAGIIK